MSMTAAELTRKHCAPCEGGVPRLSPAAVRDQLAALPEWKLTPDGQRIRREWRAKDFATALDFINRVGQIAEQEDHHPDLHLVGYRNVAIELRNSEQNDRLPTLASEFIRHQVGVIFADNLAAAVAARAATATIPIVFAIGGDPIRDGLVTSLSRPTGNLTGVTFFAFSGSALAQYRPC